MKIQASFIEHQVGTLYLVPTPIGNLQDVTPRILAILQSVSYIAAEDTRNTGQLLHHFDIKTPMISFHEHNTQQRIPELLAQLQAGKSLAQVSDAGMPSISDPGKELVAAAIEQDIPVVPLPGPNAALTALIASGIVPQPFRFQGFLPLKGKERQQVLTQLVASEVTTILYEAPHRLKRTLADLIGNFGADQAVTLGRELTKIHESFERGTLAELAHYYDTATPRGEYVIILAPYIKPLATISLNTAVEQVIAAVAEGERPTTAIKQVSQNLNISRRELYEAYHHSKSERD